MASSSRLEVDGKFICELNKLQRYSCLQKCAAVAGSAEEASEIAAMVGAEKKRDFSDIDEIECQKFAAAQPLDSLKTQLLAQIVNGELTQSKLVASA